MIILLGIYTRLSTVWGDYCFLLCSFVVLCAISLATNSLILFFLLSRLHTHSPHRTIKVLLLLKMTLLLHLPLLWINRTIHATMILVMTARFFPTTLPLVVVLVLITVLFQQQGVVEVKDVENKDPVANYLPHKWSQYSLPPRSPLPPSPILPVQHLKKKHDDRL